MANHFTDTDAHGNKLTDGRLCYVIENDDPTFPPIRIYGRTEKEILEKAARTIETGQTEINRLRTSRATQTTTPAASVPPNAAAGGPQRLTADQRAAATADLSNPAKSSQAVKALLRDEGVDVDRIKFKEETDRMAAISQEWEKQHPDFPNDDRNMRMLIDRATLLAGSAANFTAAHLDRAYADLQKYEMLHEVQPVPTPVPPQGIEDSRTTVRTRSATSYRSTALRATAPVAQPEKAPYTDEEYRSMNSKEFQHKVLEVPKVLAHYNSRFSQPVQATA